MRWQFSRFVPRSAPAVLVVLVLAVVAGFGAVSHLVTRFNLNQQARGRRLYAQGVGDQNAGKLSAAVEEFRAALTCDPTNSQYQLALGRALRDAGQLEEAKAYLEDLWQRNPEDGTINLALGRVAARRGSLEDALRYYHNAMYGVWKSDPDGNRRKARLELIEFLLQKGARVEAQPELMALASGLPPDSPLHVQTAELFEQDQDYNDALSQYEEILRRERGNAQAMAGAGEAAFHLGKYRTAERYLRMALNAKPDPNTRKLLDTASMILATDPFVRRISDAERNRRIKDAWALAGQRLQACAESRGELSPGATLQSSATPPETTRSSSAAKPAGKASSVESASTTAANAPPAPGSLAALENQWEAMKPQVSKLGSSGETDLPDAIMDLVFQIEQQTAQECGEPQGKDLALLLTSRDRDAADQ